MKSCWWHDWEPWKDRESGTLTRRVLEDPKGQDLTVGRFVVQERRCVRCKQLDLHTIRTDVTGERA
jgi:hypothetical protein